MRERVIQSIKHKETDMIPWQIDLTTGFADKLKQQTGCMDVEDYLGNHLMRAKYKQNKKLNDGYELDIFGVRWSLSKDGGDVGIVVDSPMKEAGFHGYQFPEIRKDFALELCRRMRDEPRGVFRMFSITMCFFERAWSLRGMENILTDMCLNEAFVAELFERILNHHLALLDLVLDHEFEGVYFGDDWGQQKGLIMGPLMWRKYIKPAMAKLFEKVKGKGKYVILHSCGDLREIMPELIDIGVDVYNTLQPEIYDLKELKREYGKRMSFYGGISTQQFLPMATVQESREMTRTMLELMGRGGGYILSPTHAVTPDIPVSNVLAMVEVARQTRSN
jgi:uroporphyrinogen decarboxylase